MIVFLLFICPSQLIVRRIKMTQHSFTFKIHSFHLHSLISVKIPWISNKVFTFHEFSCIIKKMTNKKLYFVNKFIAESATAQSLTQNKRNENMKQSAKHKQLDVKLTDRNKLSEAGLYQLYLY